MDESRSAGTVEKVTAGRAKPESPQTESPQPESRLESQQAGAVRSAASPPAASQSAASQSAVSEPDATKSDAPKGTAVLVHGLWMPGWETWLLRRRLEAAGYATTGFVYPTVGVGLDANVEQLAAFAEGLPSGPVHFVGHSLGGALVVKLFERHGFEGDGRIVCLGSPLNGSRPGAVLDAHPLGRRIVGRCIHDLLACGACSRWSGARELGIIAGDVPLGFGRLLGGLPSPNDGTVAVDETCIAGLADHIVLPVSHTGMVFSAAVAQQTAHFLQNGKFKR